MAHLMLGFLLSIAVSTAEGATVMTRQSKLFPDIHSYPQIASFHGREFAEKVAQLLSNDPLGTAFAPSENIPIQQTPFGELKLGYKLSSSKFSAVYTIYERKDLLIKFQANCAEIDRRMMYEPGAPYMHPLVRDYILGKDASSHGLAPNMYFLSPPSALCDAKVGKCDFGTSDENFEECRRNPRSALRYMIMERVDGMSLFQMKRDYPDGEAPFLLSLLAGCGIVKHLEMLHTTAKIIHGDIHLDNIMVESVNMTKGSIGLALIDFGRAFPNVPKLTTGRFRNSGWSTHHLYSEWEIDGFASAARDDIARAVHLIAQLMHPWTYIRSEQWISNRGVEETLRHKKESNWFISPRVPEIGYEYDPIGNLAISNDLKELIRYEVVKVLRLVQGMGHDVNAIPPYREIIQCLGNAIRLFARGRK